VLKELRNLGCRAIFLEVRAANGSAIALYERCGFRREGTRRAYYALLEEDAVLMTLRLREPAP
jgi:ribosomal-protein-alanine N-acetyltransferase